LRDETAPLDPGARVELPEMIITVVAADGRHRQRLEIETRAPLDDRSLVFFSFDGAWPVRFPLPFVGDDVLLPRGIGAFE
jgi:hypothetical protein